MRVVKSSKSQKTIDFHKKNRENNRKTHNFPENKRNRNRITSKKGREIAGVVVIQLRADCVDSFNYPVDDVEVDDRQRDP